MELSTPTASKVEVVLEGQGVEDLGGDLDDFVAGRNCHLLSWSFKRRLFVPGLLNSLLIVCSRER